MTLLDEMVKMYSSNRIAGHGGPIGSHAEETRKMISMAIINRPDLRIVLPRDGCEDCGYTPANDWNRVVGYGDAPVERYPFVPCPECVGGHPNHNQIAVRAPSYLVEETIHASKKTGSPGLVESVALESLGARLCMESNAYEWTFRRESVRVPIPPDAQRCFQDYKPLTPDGERSVVSPQKLEEMEVPFWVWRRERDVTLVAASGFTTAYKPNAVVEWDGKPLDDLMTQYAESSARQAALEIDKQILGELNKATAKAPMTGPSVGKALEAIDEEMRVRNAAAREAVVKPDLAKLKSMAPKGARSLAQALRDDIKKAIKKANG